MALPALHEPLRHADALVVGQRIGLNPHHVRGLRARQINTKEAFTLADREGRYFRASLTTLDAESGEALVYEAMATSPESPVHLTLLCAVLGRQRMLGVIQKATELGVMRIVPVLSERSVLASGLEHEKAHAWPAQALRAARQCRRASLPEVQAAIPLARALEQASFRDADRRVYLDDRAAPQPPLQPKRDQPLSLAFVVGPEGGFSDDERRLLDAHEASSLRLGGRVLRAETAVLVGLTLLQHAYGDM